MRNKGFTLIEVMIVIVIMAIMTTAIFAMLIYGWNAVTRMTEQREQTDDLRYFVVKMEKDLRNMTRNGYYNSGNDIRFYIAKEKTATTPPKPKYYLARYFLSGNVIYYDEQEVTGLPSMSAISSAAPTSTRRQVILKNVTSFSVTPLKTSGNPHTQVLTFVPIKVVVQHAMPMPKGAVLNRTINLTITPRNMVSGTILPDTLGNP